MNKKKKRLLLLLILGIIILILIISFFINKKEEYNDYSSYYSKFVITNKDAKMYIYENNEYIEKGIIYKGTIIELDENYDSESEYFKIIDLDNKYYIKFSDIEKSDNYYQEYNRYKNYIVFNENIVTNEKTTFYKDGEKIYTINESFNLPIIIKDENKFYVEYNNMLLYVLTEEVSEIINSNNTEGKNTSGVGVLNYHFVYKPEEEICNQEICHTEEQFRTHLSYIKDNGYFTPTMNELEMYIDGKLQLPKSVVITIDDGRNVNLAIEILEEYKLNATAFIVTGRYNMETDFIKSEYVEMHSHSHNLHDAGTCPPGHGQGGGLTCLSDEEVLNDIKMTREALNGSTVFCYPFYEYTAHSIELLKQGGFTMAFAGETPGAKNKATVGMDKFKIPRFVVVTWTTMDDFKSYLADV
ncbi:MAG: polysaccharide deacetylase family protein [Bacilli bacterium]